MQKGGVIQDYIDFRSSIENITNEKTLRTEKFVLETFSRYLKNKSFKQASEKDIVGYLKVYSNKTKDSRITILKKFYRWLYDIEKGEKLPDCIRRIKRTVRSPLQYYNNLDYRDRVIIEEEYVKIIDNARSLMHKAMIETLYCFGCRASELLSMNSQDVEYKDGITKITVRQSKTKPRDIVYLGRPEYLMKWYENYQHFRDQRDKPFWTNFQKKQYNRYTINGLGKALNIICKRAGLRHITSHDFRHTAITNARARGEVDTDIQSNFGLSKTSVMMGVYDHNKTKDYEEKLKKRAEDIEPTYELLEKQKETLEKKHEKELADQKRQIEAMKEVLQVVADNMSGLANSNLRNNLKEILDQI